MATYENRGKKIRVKIELQGVTTSKTFDTKTDAKAWATATEADILAGKLGKLPDKTFGELLDKYSLSLDPERRRADKIRLARIVRNDKIALVKLCDLDSTHAATWRDDRLKQVSAASVRREWNILSPACKKAIVEWKWLDNNPFSEVKRPPKPESRSRRPSDKEIELIKHTSGYNEGVATATARIGAAFLFAIETGMRIGEICHLQKEDLRLDEGYLKVAGIGIGGRKTRGAKRDVSLSPEAIRILKQLGDDVFAFSSSQSVDALWREKIIKKALIKDLHFHDSRHEAITRLARKLDILDLARMVGVVDLKTLMVYYNPTAAEISKRLAA